MCIQTKFWLIKRDPRVLHKLLAQQLLKVSLFTKSFNSVYIWLIGTSSNLQALWDYTVCHVQIFEVCGSLRQSCPWITNCPVLSQLGLNMVSVSWRYLEVMCYNIVSHPSSPKKIAPKIVWWEGRPPTLPSERFYSFVGFPPAFHWRHHWRI